VDLANLAHQKAVLPTTRFPLTINGLTIHTPDKGEAINPATGQTLASHALADVSHADKAVVAAKHALKSWREIPQAERQAMVAKLADTIADRREAFIRLLTAEQGKPRAGAEWEIDGSIHWLREVAQQSLPSQPIAQQADPALKVSVRRVPLGVVAAITPWNFPLLLAVWKIAPALVTGNTVIVKPSPFTPLCTLWFGELAQSVLPPGVLNVIAGGNELGQFLAEHNDVDKVAFTGSTETGRKVMRSAASNLKRVTLELGGNDPAIVLPDVDVEQVAPKLFWAAFQNSGQFCVATKRLYVHDSIYDQLCAALVRYASTVTVGDGSLSSSALGPLQNRMQYEKVLSLIEDTRKAGHRFLLGGRPDEQPGYFVPVTLIDNPPDDARCVVEEAFGPVLPLLKFSTIDEVVERANATPFGLAASVWSADVNTADSIARRLAAGTVWINQVHAFSPSIPFAGQKQSGVGVENGDDGLAEYTSLQVIMK
jgi:acyl-CoA reductase-like NAD-dependent aldehyde dehydrogenase